MFDVAVRAAVRINLWWVKSKNRRHLDTAATSYLCPTQLGLDKHNAANKQKNENNIFKIPTVTLKLSHAKNCELTFYLQIIKKMSRVQI